MELKDIFLRKKFWRAYFCSIISWSLLRQIRESWLCVPVKTMFWQLCLLELPGVSSLHMAAKHSQIIFIFLRLDKHVINNRVNCLLFILKVFSDVRCQKLMKLQTSLPQNMMKFYVNIFTLQSGSDFYCFQNYVGAERDV